MIEIASAHSMEAPLDSPARLAIYLFTARVHFIGSVQWVQRGGRMYPY